MYICNAGITIATTRKCSDCSKPVCEDAGLFNKFTLPSHRVCADYDHSGKLVNGSEVEESCEPIQCDVSGDDNTHLTS